MSRVELSSLINLKNQSDHDLQGSDTDVCVTLENVLKNLQFEDITAAVYKGHDHWQLRRWRKRRISGEFYGNYI